MLHITNIFLAKKFYHKEAKIKIYYFLQIVIKMQIFPYF